MVKLTTSLNAEKSTCLPLFVSTAVCLMISPEYMLRGMGWASRTMSAITMILLPSSISPMACHGPGMGFFIEIMSYFWVSYHLISGSSSSFSMNNFEPSGRTSTIGAEPSSLKNTIVTSSTSLSTLNRLFKNSMLFWKSLPKAMTGVVVFFVSVVFCSRVCSAPLASSSFSSCAKLVGTKTQTLETRMIVRLAYRRILYCSLATPNHFLRFFFNFVQVCFMLTYFIGRCLNNL